MAQRTKQERTKKVIEALNKECCMELHAIHQYLNQHYNLDNMDHGELAAKLKPIPIDEMRHAEMFAERVKELGGEPGLLDVPPDPLRRAPFPVFSSDAP